MASPNASYSSDMARDRSHSPIPARHRRNSADVPGPTNRRRSNSVELASTGVGRTERKRRGSLPGLWNGDKKHDSGDLEQLLNDDTRATDQHTIDDLRHQLEDLKLKYKKSKEWHKFELREALRQANELEEQIRYTMLCEEKDNEEDYMKLLEAGIPDKPDAQYISSLHRKLGRAFAKVEERNEQIRKMQEGTHKLVQSFQEEIEETVHAKCELELKYINQQKKFEKERRAMQERLDFLVREASQNGSASNPAENGSDYDTPMKLGGIGKVFDIARKSLTSSDSSRGVHDKNGDTRLHLQLMAKDERISQLEEEIYKKDRMINKWNMNSEDAVFDEMTGKSYDSRAFVSSKTINSGVYDEDDDEDNTEETNDLTA